MPKLWNEKPVFTRSDVETRHIGQRLHVEVAGRTLDAIDNLLAQSEEVNQKKQDPSARDPVIDAKPAVALNTAGWVRRVLWWILIIGWHVALGTCWAVFFGFDQEAEADCLDGLLCGGEPPFSEGCVQSRSDEIEIGSLTITAGEFCITTARRVGGMTTWRLVIFLFFLWPTQLVSWVLIRLIMLAISSLSGTSATVLTGDVRRAASYCLRTGLWLGTWRILMEPTDDRANDAKEWNKLAGREIWPTTFANTYGIVTDVLVVLLLWDASFLLKVVFGKVLALKFYESAHKSLLMTTYTHERLIASLLQPFRMATKMSITLDGRTSKLKGLKVAHWKALNFMAGVKAQHESHLETQQSQRSVEAEHVQHAIDKADKVINMLANHLANDIVGVDEIAADRHVITPWLSSKVLVCGVNTARSTSGVTEADEEAVSAARSDTQRTTSQPDPSHLDSGAGRNSREPFSRAASGIPESPQAHRVDSAPLGYVNIVDNPLAGDVADMPDANTIDGPAGRRSTRRVGSLWRKAARDATRRGVPQPGVRPTFESAFLYSVAHSTGPNAAARTPHLIKQLSAMDFKQAVELTVSAQQQGRFSSFSRHNTTTTTIYSNANISMRHLACNSVPRSSVDANATLVTVGDTPLSYQDDGMAPICEIDEAVDDAAKEATTTGEAKQLPESMSLLQKLKLKTTIQDETDLWLYMTGNPYLRGLAAEAAEHSHSETAEESSILAARTLGYYLFWNLHGQDMLALTKADFVEALERQGRSYHHEYFQYFDRNGSGSVTLEETMSAVEGIYQQRKSLARTVCDNEAVIQQVTQAFGGLLFVVIVFAAVAIFDTGTFARSWTALSAALISLSFIFGGAVREMFENTLFLFLSHPFDVGDLVVVDKERYEVRSIALTYVTLQKPDMSIITSPLAQLRMKDIHNMSRSPALWGGADFVVDSAVYMQALEALGEAVKTAIILESSHFGGNYRVYLTDTSPALKVVISVYYDLADNGTNLIKMNLAKTIIILSAHDALQKADISYTFPATAGNDATDHGVRRMFSQLSEHSTRAAASSAGQSDSQRTDLAAAGGVLTLA